MTALRLIIVAFISLVSIAGSIRAADLSDHFIFEQGETLRGRIGVAGAVEQLSDRAHYERVDHDGRHWYILHRFDGRRTWLKILECDSSGALQGVRTVVDDQLRETTAVEQAQFMPDGRLFIVLHVNPSLSVAIALDSRTGERSILLGHTFTPDASGRHIAYFRETPQDARKSEVAELWVDGKRACQLPAEQANAIIWTAAGSAVAH